MGYQPSNTRYQDPQEEVWAYEQLDFDPSIPLPPPDGQGHLAGVVAATRGPVRMAA